MRRRISATLLVACLAVGMLSAGGVTAKPFDPGTGTATCGTGTVTFTPAKLWPPNHTLRDVTFTSTTPFTVTAVTHEEEGIEKGSTAKHEPDFVLTDATGGTAEGDNAVVQLLAERRAKPKDGRTYTVTLSCGTAEAPVTTTATVVVPHSRKKA